MKNTIYVNIFFISLLIILSCSNDSYKHFSLTNFNKIKLQKLNKNSVKFSTSFNFLNESDKDVKIIKSDFDILINGIDVSSHINNFPITVSSKKNYEIPVQVEFTPSKVFSDYKTGLVKIKSDIVAKLKITGIVLVEIDSEQKNIKYSDEQLVLFTNNKKLILNNEGEITQKD